MPGMALENGSTEREIHLAALTKAYNFLAEALAPAGVQPTPQNISNNRAQLHNLVPSQHGESRSRLDVDILRRNIIFLEDHSPSDKEDDDETFFPHQSLEPESFNEDDLINHLRTYAWDEKAAHVVLGTLLADKDKLQANLLVDETKSWNHASRTTHHIIADVGSNGRPIYRGSTVGRPSHRNQKIWRIISATNVGSAHTVGRITIIQEPSPSMFAALHLTMSPHFDMDQVFRILSDDCVTKAYMRGCFEAEPRQQRSFALALQYHALTADDRNPMPWQSFSQDGPHAYPLATCSSVVALSLEGLPMAMIKSRPDSGVLGHVFDPFSPWRVLSIQCFSDWSSSPEPLDKNTSLLNGPEAFLSVLLNEYKDAVKRLTDLSSSLSQLFRPPVSRLTLSSSLPATVLRFFWPHQLMFPQANSIFNQCRRDALMCEDDEFTMSRRYFWGGLVFDTVADDIHGLICAYRNTFTEDVWTGEHKYIWPGTKEVSSRYAFWRKRMVRLRKLFENEMDALEDLLGKIELSRKEIRSRAEDMYRATAVLEARKTIQHQAITVVQGHNIKLLTLVTVWFLPLTFVACIFGMTNMPAQGSFVHFGITVVCVCIPVYTLIGSLNTGNGFEFWMAKFCIFWRKKSAGFRGDFNLSKTGSRTTVSEMELRDLDPRGSKFYHSSSADRRRWC